MFWFPTVQTIITLILIWFMPKRLTRLEIYISWAVISLIALAMDVWFALILKLYDMATPKPDWQVLAFEFLLPPAYGVISLNFMPSRRTTFIAYLIGAVFVSDCIELLNVHFRYITYRKWNIGYSTLIYILGLLFIRWHIHFIRRNNQGP